MPKKAIASVHYPISKRDSSHRAGWARIWADILDADILHCSESYENYDTVFLYHGMEFNGSLNLFGGAKDVTHFKNFLNADTQFISLDVDMPDFGSIGKQRLTSCSEDWKQFPWDELSDKCNKITPMKMSMLTSEKLIIGDSHANAMYVKDSIVNRNDGQTLYGALKKGLKSFIIGHGVKDLTFYFGNIDIRHHLCNYESDNLSTLLLEYERQLLDISANYSISIVAPMYIENESRKIPKTGWHNKKPFTGDWDSRDIMRAAMTGHLSDMCIRNKWDFIKHPDFIKNSLGELSEDFMEKPQSVHISPKYYRRWL